jgi:pyruvate dehydrogenase E2 component (dihydrolipoamide acetyltransferase)
MDCNIDSLLTLRVKLKDAGVNVSVNDMVIAAAARALRVVPEANAFFDAKSGKVKANGSVDVSVAVATDGGLITPIVKSADTLSLGSINAKVKDLAGRARANKLKPEEFQGGSFTISNLGMFPSINEFSAVINPPQACILAVGKGEQRVLPPTTKGGSPFVATVMSLQLSSDARVVEGHIAGQFLQALRAYLEDPTLLVIDKF